MEYTAISKNIKITPRKTRLVADAVKRHGGKIDVVLGALTITNKRASDPIKKAIESAISNALNNFNAKKENLTLKEVVVNEGVAYKRYHYAGRGRIRPYKKKTSHIKVVLEDKQVKENIKVEDKEVKKEKEEKKEK